MVLAHKMFFVEDPEGWVGSPMAREARFEKVHEKCLKLFSGQIGAKLP